MRNAIIGRFLDEARSISLPTCEDAMALSDNTSTKTLAPLIARTIASAYSAPAFTSRGAIQHGRLTASSAAHNFSATATFCDA
ncbi:MAG TPA: hypothetical protein VN989_05655 [Casimicrobiaceae bacterium]|nr:hypothetical protein [Casimicrobiaceae bacterium]